MNLPNVAAPMSAALETRTNRRVWLETDAVPAGVRVLGMRVRVPALLFADPEGIADEYTWWDTVTAFAELTPEEFESGRASQQATDALAEALAPDIAAALGGYVKHWIQGVQP